MSRRIQHWIIFAKGVDDENEERFFTIPYSGKKIVWEYLVDLIEEDYGLRYVSFNGYNVISKRKFEQMSDK